MLTVLKNIFKQTTEESYDESNEDLNLKEIGRILEVTESRVSQLHTQAVEKLRARLKDQLKD